MGPHANNKLSLVEPFRECEDSYRRLIQEIVALGEQPVPFTLGFKYERFDDLLKQLKDNSMGIGVPSVSAILCERSYHLN